MAATAIFSRAKWPHCLLFLTSSRDLSPRLPPPSLHPASVTSSNNAMLSFTFLCFCSSSSCLGFLLEAEWTSGQLREDLLLVPLQAGTSNLKHLGPSGPFVSIKSCQKFSIRFWVRIPKSDSSSQPDLNLSCCQGDRLANKNTECPFKFEFQINNTYSV